MVRVFLHGFERYDILAAESIYVTVPGAALASQQPIVALPAAGRHLARRGRVESVMGGRDHVAVRPTAGRVLLSGSCDGVREELLRSLAECDVASQVTNSGSTVPPVSPPPAIRRLCVPGSGRASTPSAARAQRA